ncbi:MAG: Aryl-alcohol dehydrogenase [Sphingomonas bacterium]|nr:Aryl-alcohol dehydrogenase [Sphingomonas bacterium]
MRITAAVSRDGEAAPRLEQVDLSGPRAGELLVRIVAVGICHTDLRVHAGGGVGTPRPVVLGHEGAGIVEAVGEGVTHIRPGDHVVLSGSSCGHCPSCLANFPTYCREVMPRSFGGQRMDGTSALSQGGAKLHGHFFGQSSFATYAIADARGAVPIGKDVPFDVAAPMGCGILTGAGSVFYSFAMRPNHTLVVFGTGPVGLAAVMAAKLVGARRIIAVDPIAGRRALAEELGATDTIDPAAGDVAEAVLALLPEGVDFSLNTTAVPAVFDAAVKVLGMMGTAGFVTAPPGPWTTMLQPLLAGGRSIRGIINGSAVPQIAIPMMLDHWRQGNFPVDRLVRRYPFADIADAFHDCHNGTAIKPVLHMENA